MLVLVSMIKKIIFIVESLFNARDYQRFGIDLLIMVVDGLHHFSNRAPTCSVREIL